MVSSLAVVLNVSFVSFASSEELDVVSSSLASVDSVEVFSFEVRETGLLELAWVDLLWLAAR